MRQPRRCTLYCENLEFGEAREGTFTRSSITYFGFRVPSDGKYLIEYYSANPTGLVLFESVGDTIILTNTVVETQQYVDVIYLTKGVYGLSIESLHVSSYYLRVKPATAWDKTKKILHKVGIF